MPEQTFVVQFPGATMDEASMHVRSLAEYLKEEVPPHACLKAEPRRASKDTQDFGTTLVLVLGTPAAIVLAKGIYAWLKGHTGANMEITTEHGRVVVKNVESKSAAEIAKAFTDAEQQ